MPHLCVVAFVQCNVMSSERVHTVVAQGHSLIHAQLHSTRGDLTFAEDQCLQHAYLLHRLMWQLLVQLCAVWSRESAALPSRCAQDQSASRPAARQLLGVSGGPVHLTRGGPEGVLQGQQAMASTPLLVFLHNALSLHSMAKPLLVLALLCCTAMSQPWQSLVPCRLHKTSR